MWTPCFENEWDFDANWHKFSTGRARKDYLWGSGDQRSRSRSHEAEDRLGGLAEASFSSLDPLGSSRFRVYFLCDKNLAGFHAVAVTRLWRSSGHNNIATENCGTSLHGIYRGAKSAVPPITTSMLFTLFTFVVLSSLLSACQGSLAIRESHNVNTGFILRQTVIKQYFNNSVKCPCNVIHHSVTLIFTFLIIIIIIIIIINYILHKTQINRWCTLKSEKICEVNTFYGTLELWKGTKIYSK